MSDTSYKTKDIWVAMCLLVLGEQLVRVRYDPIIKKVFFIFDTPLTKGRAIEAVFASGDRRLALPVVDLHKAYEYLHRWRIIVSEARSELSLHGIANSFEEITEQRKHPIPETLDETIAMLQKEVEEETSQ